MKVGIYARVSTHEQQSLPTQIKALRAYVQKRKWQIVLQVKEVGSGATQRPQRSPHVQAARRRELDVIVVWRLDRWGRSLADLVVTLKALTELGVGARLADRSFGFDAAARVVRWLGCWPSLPNSSARLCGNE